MFHAHFLASVAKIFYPSFKKTLGYALSEINGIRRLSKTEYLAVSGDPQVRNESEV